MVALRESAEGKSATQRCKGAEGQRACRVDASNAEVRDVPTALSEIRGAR